MFVRELFHALLEFEAAESAAVVVIVRVLRVGDVRAGGGVDRHHDRQVGHRHGAVVRRGGVGPLRLGVLGAAALDLVLDLVALIADGHAAARVGGDVGPRAEDGAGRREVRRVLEALGAGPGRLRRRLVDAGEGVPAHGAVDPAVAEARAGEPAVGVVGEEGGGGGGPVARGCLRRGCVREVRRHDVPHLVACSVVVGPVLGPVVVRAGVRLRRRVPGVRVLLLLGVHWKGTSFRLV